MANTLEYLLKLSNGAFVGPLRQARAEQGKFIAQGAGVSKVGSRYAMLAPAIATASAALVVAAGAAVFFAVKSAASAEQTQIQFKTLTGSMEQAEQTLAELSAFAASTPFELPQLADAAKKLLAARVPTSALMTELGALGNVASATGADIGMLSTVYGQMAGKGKIYAEDMQQFVEAGAGEIKQALAESLKVSTAGLNDLMTDGKVGFSDMQRALQSLAGTSGKWSASMEDQSRTTLGLFSTLKDNVGQIFRAFGQPINDGPVKTYLSQLVNLTGSAATTLSAAIKQGKLGETLANALTWGAKSGINAVIGFVEELPKRIRAVFETVGRSIKAVLMGQVDLAKELLGTFDPGKMRFDTSKEEAFFKSLTAGATAAGEGMKDAADWAEKLDSTLAEGEKKVEKKKTQGDAEEKGGRKRTRGFSYKASGANSGFGGLAEFDRLQAHSGKLDNGRHYGGAYVNKAFKDGAYKMPSTAAAADPAAPDAGGMRRRMMGSSVPGLSSWEALQRKAPIISAPGAAKAAQARTTAAATAAASQKGAHPLAALIKTLDDKLGKIAVA